MTKFDGNVNIEYFEKVFKFFLTHDIATDRRKRLYNQGIFDEVEGFANYQGTDVEMVLYAFDMAAKAIKLHVETDIIESDPDYAELRKVIITKQKKGTKCKNNSV